MARDSANRARSFANSLKEKIEKIPSMPYSYRKNNIANDENICDLIFKGYVVIFEISTKNIEILDIYKHNLPKVF
ncbi:type II toxin-antitoxin system RelE/ParE family toxin [Campylobacter sp.]|uniref:type II toxin-antitoxin system RelE/ParE family toxin n=1 Tax=Campylobacter sp. TaxID=205 RepID=UPI003456FE60